MEQRTPDDRMTSWTRHATIGIEYVAAVAGFGLAGWWVDSRWDTSPWGVLIGTALGLIGGTYNLVRTTLAAFRVPPKDLNSEHERKSE